MKSRDGKGQRREEKKKEQSKKDQKKEDPLICGSGRSKSRLAKAAAAKPAGQMRDEKLHAVVARSTFPSQNVQSTPMLGPLLEVVMSKKCMPLWREAHFEVKMLKNTIYMFAPLLDVQMSFRVAGARDWAPCQK